MLPETHLLKKINQSAKRNLCFALFCLNADLVIKLEK